MGIATKTAAVTIGTQTVDAADITLAADDMIVGNASGAVKIDVPIGTMILGDGSGITTVDMGASAGNILVDSGTTAASVAVSGDATLAANGALTVTDVTLGSDAAGDIHYKTSATVTARLAKGTAQQTLKMNSGATAPEWRGPKEIYEDFSGYAAADDPLVLEADGTAYSATAGAINVIHTPAGNKLVAAPIVGQTIGPVMIAGGLDVGGDQVENDGFEIYSNQHPATGTPFSVGVDPAFYFHCKLQVADMSGVDAMVVGFRLAGVMNGDYTAYDTYAGLGWAAKGDDVQCIIELNGGADANTDTTDTVGDTTDVEFKVLVSAAGVVTFQHDVATPGTLAAPTAVATITFDDGDQVIPFLTFLNTDDLADNVEIILWDAGYQ